MEKSKADYFTGCLMGGAIGDAIGAPVEFFSLRNIRERFGEGGVTGYVEFSDGHGEFTDDTQMTLFTAEALLIASHKNQLNDNVTLTGIAHHAYLRWLITQDVQIKTNQLPGWDSAESVGGLMNHRLLFKQRAPGNTCLSALMSGKAGTLQQPINNSKGCGTIMRMAPVGLAFAGQPEKAFTVGCDLSAITHGHPSGYLAAGYFASLIAILATGTTLTEAISKAILLLKKWDNHRETLTAVESALNVFSTTSPHTTPAAELAEQLGRGWIAEEALSISLLSSLIYEHDFRMGVLYAVNHGGDSDSTGSITGNILGLINGIQSLPKEWIKNLSGAALVYQMGEELSEVSSSEY